MVNKELENWLMMAEEKIACRFAAKHQAVPPVDIEMLAKKYSKLEYIELPINADAITLRIKTDHKPIMLVNKGHSNTRNRFTIAHELGHIIIPWHVGIIISHIDYAFSEQTGYYGNLEAEANRFASELLMPSSWIENSIQESKRLSQLYTKMSKAETSPISFTIALFQHLPPGYIFVEVDLFKKVKNCGRSSNSDVRLPSLGEKFNEESYLLFADDKYVIRTSDSSIYWIRLGSRKKSTEENTDSRSSKEIMDQIIIDLKWPKDKAFKCRQSLAGIIGAANNRTNRTDLDSIVNALRKRLAGRPELIEILKHKDFNTCLINWARELLSRR